MIDGRRREADAHMDIDLLLVRDFVGRSKMQKMARPSTLRKIPRVLHERVHRFYKLPVQQKRRFTGEVAMVSLRGQ